MNQSTINERLKFLIDNSGLSVRAFSAAVGVTDTNTRNYIDRGSKPNSDFLGKLLRRFHDINPTWLLLGEGEPFVSQPADAAEPAPRYQKNNPGSSPAARPGPSPADYEKQRDAYKAERDGYKRENELLREQLAMKDALIAAKDETIGLLRGGYSRPG